MNNISMTTLSAAEDYYVALISSVEASRSSVSPMLQFSNQISNEYQGNSYLFVKENRIPGTDNVTSVKFALLSHVDDKRAGRCLGELDPAGFKELEDVLDQALSDYRRDHFKKISRSQRHMKESNYAR